MIASFFRQLTETKTNPKKFLGFGLGQRLATALRRSTHCLSSIMYMYTLEGHHDEQAI